jgi:hypothetical protein
MVAGTGGTLQRTVRGREVTFWLTGMPTRPGLRVGVRGSTKMVPDAFTVNVLIERPAARAQVTR